MTGSNDSPTLSSNLLQSGFWAFVGRVGSLLLVVVANALAARALDRTAMGAYFLSISFVWGLSIIWQFGLNQAIIRLVSSTWTTHKKQEAVGFVIASICLVSAIMLSSSVLTLVPQVNALLTQTIPSPLITQNIHLVIVWAMLFTLQSLSSETFRGLQRIDRASLLGGLTTHVIVVTSLGFCLLTNRPLEFSQVAWIYICSIGVSVIGSLSLLIAELRPVAPYVRPHLVSLIRISWPFLVTNVTLFLLSQSDLWILGVIGSEEDIAIYAGAVRLALLITIPLSIVNSVLPPFISELHTKHQVTALQAMLRGSAWIGLLPAVTIWLIYLLVGRTILSLVFGQGYDAGYSILVVIGFGHLSNIAAGTPGFTLLMTGHQRAMMMITLISALIAISFGLYLMLTWGPMGLACGSASGLLFQTLAMWAYTKKTLDIWTHPSVSELGNLRSICTDMFFAKGASRS